MRTERITESKTTPIELESQEAEALNALGRSLASKSQRPGLEDDDVDPDRSVIRCRRTDREGVYSLRVSEAVGVIGVLGRLQIEVQPKIPLQHLIYLLTAAEELPRLDEQAAEVELGDNLLNLIARWYVKAAQRLLRRGLVKDYSQRRDFLAAKRGRFDAMHTARAYYAGRMGFECEFDEFDTETALNRVVREGASVVVRNPSLTQDIRRQALRIRNRMDGVSRIRVGDLRAEIDRRSGHYTPSLPLAKQLIRAEGRSLRGGARDTWSFLVRTPEMVEHGMRKILQEGLAPRWSIDKGYARAQGSNVTFHPDVAFGGGIAVGDVKYKLQGADWNRGDLNQIVTFVAAYSCKDGAVFNFRDTGRQPLSDLGVGSQRIESITWPIGEDIDPAQAARSLVLDTARWLSRVVTSAESAA